MPRPDRSRRAKVVFPVPLAPPIRMTGFSIRPSLPLLGFPLVAYQTILFDIDADHVATLTLNRPEVMDAFNQQMADECADVWRRVKEDDGVHAVVLRAAGSRAFCSGRDVDELAALRSSGAGDHVEPRTSDVAHGVRS